jgi:hypothetical protein
MISFPSTSWQSSLIQKTTSRRSKNNADPLHGRAATAITPRLYLTDYHTARIPGKLARLGVTHVVSAIDFDITGVFPPQVQVLHVPVRDSAEQQICEWFDPVVEFIKQALDREDTKVLVRWLLNSHFVGTDRGTLAGPLFPGHLQITYPNLRLLGRNYANVPSRVYRACASKTWNRRSQSWLSQAACHMGPPV